MNHEQGWAPKYRYHRTITLCQCDSSRTSSNPQRSPFKFVRNRQQQVIKKQVNARQSSLIIVREEGRVKSTRVSSLSGSVRSYSDSYLVTFVGQGASAKNRSFKITWGWDDTVTTGRNQEDNRFLKKLTTLHTLAYRKVSVLTLRSFG